MAMIDTAPRAPFGAITTFRVTNTLSELVSTAKTWIENKIEERRTAAALSRLSPAMLEDIGLTAADVAQYRSTGSFL